MMTKLLLVEDEITHYRLFERNFERSKWDAQLDWVQMGDQAIRMLDDIDPSDTIVILDINLPDMSGIEILRYIRKDERLKDMIVVMVTSSRLTDERDECRRLGVFHYFEKPVEYRTMLNLLKTSVA